MRQPVLLDRILKWGITIDDDPSFTFVLSFFLLFIELSSQHIYLLFFIHIPSSMVFPVGFSYAVFYSG